MNPRSTLSRLALPALALLVLATGCRVANPLDRVPAQYPVPPAAQLDVAYGTDAPGCAGPGSDLACGGSQTLDVYRPTGGGNRGVLVFVHGGGFAAGDKSEVSGLGNVMRQTARGYGVVSVNYRLVQGGRNLFPTAVQDVAAALRWVQANGAAAGLATSKVVVVGHSAGGTLAALMGTAGNSGRPEYAGIPPLAGWISISGILDPMSGPKSALWMRTMVGEPFTSRAPAAAPLMHLDAGDPAGYVVHGDLDDVVEFNNVTRLESRMVSVGARGKVTIDVVDVANGRPLDAQTRGHYPFSGINAAEMDRWIDAR